MRGCTGPSEDLRRAFEHQGENMARYRFTIVVERDEEIVMRTGRRG